MLSFKYSSLSLRRYLCPVDCALDPLGPLSPAVSHIVIGKVNTELDASNEKVKPTPLATANGLAWLLFLHQLVSSPTLTSHVF